MCTLNRTIATGQRSKDVMNKLLSFSLIGRWLPAMLLAALALPVPHAKAVTAAECTGRYTSDTLTVRDNDTGLTWQRTADPAGRAWIDADSYCQNLTLAGGGWRLPNIFELQTIVDESVTGPSLDPAFDPVQANGIYCSSTSHADAFNQAWAIDFGMVYIGGTVTPRPKIEMLRVRCVR
jgi:hypothetical protein